MRDPGSRWPSDSRRPKRSTRHARPRPGKLEWPADLLGEPSAAEALIFERLARGFGPNAGSLDAYLLGELCRIQAVRIVAMGQLREFGPLVPGPDGVPMANPLVRVVGQLSVVVGRGLGFLGLTPAQLDSAPDSAGVVVDHDADRRLQGQMDAWQRQADDALRLIRGGRE